MKKNKALYLVLVLILGLVLIGLWISFIDVTELKNQILDVRPVYLLLASVIYLSAYFLRSLRWNLLVSPVVKLSILQSWLFSMGGNFANYLIPIRIGEFVKAWLAKKSSNVPIVNLLPSIFIDKSFDTIGILIVLLVLPFVSIKISYAVTVLLSLLVLVFLASLIIILTAAFHKETSIKVLSLVVKVFPRKIGEKLSYYIRLFVEGLNIFDHHWSKLILALMITAIGIILDGFYFYLVFRAFDVSISYLVVLFGYTLINLSYALPQPPAQLGSNEWMMIIIFSIGFGLTVEGVSAIMATAHVLTALIIALGGVAAFAYSGTNILKLVFKGDEFHDK